MPWERGGRAWCKRCRPRRDRGGARNGAQGARWYSSVRHARAHPRRGLEGLNTVEAPVSADIDDPGPTMVIDHAEPHHWLNMVVRVRAMAVVNGSVQAELAARQG